MELSYLIKEYGRYKGVNLSLDANGICTLLINDNYYIGIEESAQEEGFFIYSQITTVYPGQEAEIGILALSGNLFGKETGHASIGYDPNSRALILFQYLDKERVDLHFFIDEFNAFVQTLQLWHEKKEIFYD